MSRDGLKDIKVCRAKEPRKRLNVSVATVYTKADTELCRSNTVENKQSMLLVEENHCSYILCYC